MIGTIRKHSKWLWGVVITATIVTFVFWGSSTSSGPGGRAPKYNFGFIDGKPITLEQYSRARREANLWFFFRYRDWPDRVGKQAGFDEEDATYEWLFWVHMMERYRIQVDGASVGAVARNYIHTLKFASFEELLRTISAHATEDDFYSYITHELGIQQLREIVGLSGDVVTPQEAQALYMREHQEIVTDAVFFSASNYLAGVAAPAPQVLTQYFALHQADYRLPDRVQVRYVKFDATNFLQEADQVLAGITNLNAEIDRAYEQRGTNFYRDAKTPEEAKQKIREEARHGEAMRAANKQAESLTEKLYNLQPLNAENLAALAKTNGFTVRMSDPFDQAYGPKEFDGGPNFAVKAFSLTPEEPFSEQPLVSKDSIYVIAYGRKIPSEVPSLETIRDRVISDYRYAEALQLAQRAGADFGQKATNQMASGKNFTNICAEAKLKPVHVPPLSISTSSLPEVEDYMSLNGYNDQRFSGYKQIVFNTLVGETRGFMPTPDGGVVVYVRQRLPLDMAKVRAELPSYFETIRQRRKNESFNFWVQRQRGQLFRDIPAMNRQRQAPAPGGGGAG